jgi:glycosyltransferase involved in cell wall biosynthesis
MKVGFVTHFCPHYRVKTFETLAQYCDVEFFFYSEGKEWYGQGIHGVCRGNFRHRYLRGFQLSRHTRIAPSLVAHLWRGKYDVFVKCINGRFALPITYLTARLRGIPFVLWTGIWTTLKTPLHRLAFPITRWIYRHADAIVVYGDHVRNYLLTQGVPKEKIFVARHAVDNSAYSAAVDEEEKARCRTSLSINGSKVILYLGRFEEIKGLEYLIKAFARLKTDNCVLVMAGDGSLRDRLVGLAREQGVEANTRFVGYVSPKDAQRYYAIADLFVIPSVTMPTGRETWGLVVNEAMNQGLPVVATDAVGAAAGGLVQSGVNGYAVPERDSIALATAMQHILSDDSLRNQMALNARSIVSSWNNEAMVKGFRRAIEYALSNRTRKVFRKEEESCR